MLCLVAELCKVKRDQALLLAVALNESLFFYIVRVKAKHYGIFHQIDRLVIEAAIELVQCLCLAALVDIDKTGVDHFPYASRSLTLQVDHRGQILIGPVDKIHPASVC